MVKIKQNIPLILYTTFNIGGKAKFFVEVKSVEELAEAIKFKRDNRLPHFVLGGGSNILVSDDGFDGLVIKIDIRGLWINDLRSRLPTGVVLRVRAGEMWDDIVRASVERGLTGIEYLSGIPGTVGGAVVQNIGAYGQSLSDMIESVGVFDVKTGELKELPALECGFAYRGSIFKHNPRYIVVSVILKLTPSEQSVSGYHDIINYFKGKPVPGSREARKAVLKIRGMKGMLIKTSGAPFKTAGSFFKNPIVDRTTFQKIIAMIPEDEKRPWYWRQQDSGTKLAAAKLLEEAGFKKGFRLENAGISPKHSLSLVNLGNASASDIIKLAERVKTAVYDKFGVNLEAEVEYVQSLST